MPVRCRGGSHHQCSLRIAPGDPRSIVSAPRSLIGRMLLASRPRRNRMTEATSPNRATSTPMTTPALRSPTSRRSRCFPSQCANNCALLGFRLPLRDRKFADSPLEGNGFELAVRGRGASPSSTRRAVPEPKVRKLSVPRCPAESAGASFGGEWAPRAAETSLLILPRPTLLGSYRRADSRSVQNSDEASKPLPVSCGTESSNPFPFSGESTNHRFLPMIATRCRLALRTFSAAGGDHSITSSARATNRGGSSSPIARAALRLITNSNLVGCSTGKSAGLAPLRMRST